MWFPIILLAVVSACRPDPRKQAASELLDLAAAAPFTIVSIGDRSSSELVVGVVDSAAPQLRQVVEHLKLVGLADSQYTPEQKQELLTHLPQEMISSLPVSAVRNTTYRQVGDTLRLSIAVERPERQAYLRDVVDWVYEVTGSSSSGRLPAEVTAYSAEFQSRLRRSRHGVQIEDTLLLSVLPGPRILNNWRFLSASQDSITARGEASRLLDSALFGSVEVTQFPEMVSVKGEVKASWTPSRVSVALRESAAFTVECEAAGRRGMASNFAYVSLRESRTWRDFLCFWYEERARQVNSLEPRTWRVRLVIAVGTDTLRGRWTTVTNVTSY